MGQTLSEPVVEKHTQYGEDERFIFGVSEMQGWRLTMEDAHAAVLDLDAERSGTNADAAGAASTPTPKDKRNSFFAVYDGHGGSSVARFSGDTVHHRLKATEEYQKATFEQALKRAFLATDEDLRANADFQHDPSGCTAVAALITGDGRIMVANAGDSRSVLSVNGTAKPMSYDHKPVNRGENSRIVAAGGYVEFGRVNGNLALSRALGDFEFKKNTSLPAEQQIVTADPDIIVHQSTSEDEFLVIACDGIWDVLSNQQVVDLVRRKIAERESLQDIAESVIDRCLAPDSDWGGVGCDNMTFMVIALLNGRTKEEWYDCIAERLKNGEGYDTPLIPAEPFNSSSRGGGAGARFQDMRDPVGSPRNQPSLVGLPENLVNALRVTGMKFVEDEDGYVPPDGEANSTSTEITSKSPEHMDTDDVPNDSSEEAPPPTLSAGSAATLTPTSAAGGP